MIYALLSQHFVVEIEALFRKIFWTGEQTPQTFLDVCYLTLPTVSPLGFPLNRSQGRTCTLWQKPKKWSILTNWSNFEKNVQPWCSLFRSSLEQVQYGSMDLTLPGLQESRNLLDQMHTLHYSHFLPPPTHQTPLYLMQQFVLNIFKLHIKIN